MTELDSPTTVNSMKRIAKPTLALLLLALNAPQVALAEWQVVQMRGQAWTDNRQKPLARGMQVQTGQTVETGADARLELREQTKVLRLGGSSKLLLKPQEPDNPTAVELLYGRLRANVKKANFEVRTPAAVSGVRGTEFFVSSEQDREFVCTLEGLVEVQAKANGQKFLIPPKTGVELRPGQSASLSPTAEDLVSKWKNDTDAKAFTPVIVDAYDRVDLRFHPVTDNLFWGFTAMLNTTVAENLTYTPLDSSPSLRLLQTRLSPALRWAKSLQLTWIPRLLIHSSNQKMVLDANPLLIQDNVQHLNLGELYAETQLSGLGLRLGYQTLNWDNGFYFSNNFWQFEPYLFPALRIKYAVDRHFFELVGIRRGDVGRLNAQTPVDMIAFKYDHSNWLSLFGGHRDYTANLASEPTVSRGHRLWEAGLTAKQRVGVFEYKIGGLLQKGELFEGSAQERPVSSRMFDMQMGFYPIHDESLRFDLRWIDASENFIPGFEAPYNLGFSQLVPRTNVTQYRAKMSFSPRQDDWVLALEAIQNHSVGTSRITKWQGAHHMLDEIDLSWNKVWDNSLQVIVSAIWINPTVAMSATSPTWSRKAGTGFMVYTQYSL